MTIKSYVLSALLLTFSSVALAQYDDVYITDSVDELFRKEKIERDYGTDWGYNGKHHCFKTDFNFGWYISKFQEKNGGDKRGIFGVGGSVAFQTVLKSGYGFGLNAILDNGSYDGDVQSFFLGPSFEYAKALPNGWIYSYSIGLGYGGFYIDSSRLGYSEDKGLGYFVSLEMSKRFNKWFGIGGGIRVFNVTCSKPDNYTYSSFYGTGDIRISVGPRFYF